MSYNDKLDADQQITTEERIAFLISQADNFVTFDEEECAELGREILKLVLQEFRPDLFTE